MLAAISGGSTARGQGGCFGGIGARVLGCWDVEGGEGASERRAKSHLNLSPALAGCFWLLWLAGKTLRPGFIFGALRTALIDQIAHACCSCLPPPPPSSSSCPYRIATATSATQQDMICLQPSSRRRALFRDLERAEESSSSSSSNTHTKTWAGYGTQTTETTRPAAYGREL